MNKSVTYKSNLLLSPTMRAFNSRYLMVFTPNLYIPFACPAAGDPLTVGCSFSRLVPLAAFQNRLSLNQTKTQFYD